MGKMIVTLVFKILNSIVNVIIKPIIGILNQFFDVSVLLLNLNAFFNDYLFKYIKFFKSFMFNTLCFPISLFHFVANTLITLVAISVLIRAFRFLLNLWRVWRYGR